MMKRVDKVAEELLKEAFPDAFRPPPQDRQVSYTTETDEKHRVLCMFLGLLQTKKRSSLHVSGLLQPECACSSCLCAETTDIVFGVLRAFCLSIAPSALVEAHVMRQLVVCLLAQRKCMWGVGNGTKNNPWFVVRR